VSLRTSLRNLWNDPKRFRVDPVASGIIAAGVVYVISLAWPRFRGVLETSLGVYGIAIIGVLLLAILLWWYSRPRPKILVFLSKGGTCRDPMAKAITMKLFKTHKPKHPVIIRAAGMGPISGDKASFAARTVINEMYEQDLLADHKPELLTQKLLDKADLVLAMNQSLLDPDEYKLKGWPKAYDGKVYLFKEFFGRKGDVSDPWPDGKDEATVAKYRDCAYELRQILTENFDRLVKALHV
jgi:protein-tyrosine-phosphatase